MPTDKQQTFSNEVEQEALNAVFKAMKGGSLASLVSPLIVVLVMWGAVNTWVLLIWGSLIIVGIVIQTWVVNSFLKLELSTVDAKQWGRRITAVFFYFAVLWASSIFLFYVENSLEHQLFILTLVVTLSIWTLVVGQYWFSLYYLYGPVTLAAVIVRLIMEGSLAHYGLAILLIWVGLTTLFVAKNLNSTARSEIRLRHQSALLNKELLLKTSEAQRATLAKSRFLAAASHDLRQPLHALSLFVDVLRESKSESERNAVFLRVDQSLSALGKLFNSLLDVSRLDAGIVKPDISHFNIAELLQSLEEEFRLSASQKNLKFKVHACSIVVVSDRVLLERVLRNLVSNAIRYTESGGVLLSCRQRGKEILLQVWDTGVGIAKEHREEIFVEFQQLHNSHRDRAEGLGLGLAMVRRICQLLDHPLTLSSEPGKGSIFSLRIPKGSESLLVDRRSTIRGHSWDLTGRRVLVIDDEKEILTAMETLLSKWGCEVVTAQSLDEAIIFLNQRNIVPEVMLCDYRLREDKNGIEAINALRKQYGESIPGILVTGENIAELNNLVEQNNIEILQKPLRPMHLRSVIHHYLSGLDT